MSASSSTTKIFAFFIDVKKEIILGEIKVFNLLKC